MVTHCPDFLVIGLGAMGSAITCQLARQGAKVVAIDQFTPPHTHGSTHGESRITRQAVGEGLALVPLVMRSHQLWREMEAQTGEVLLNACGGLLIAREGESAALHGLNDFLGRTFHAAKTFGITHERLDAADIAARYPQFVLHGDEVAYFEPGAGVLYPEACVQAQLMLAARHGATLNFGETVQHISINGGRARVETDRARYAPGTTIVAAGAWTPQLLPSLAATLIVRRQVMHWFALDDTMPLASTYMPGNFPVFIWLWGSDEGASFYGFPDIGADGEVRAIKVATEQTEHATTPEAINRTVSAAETAAMYARHVAGKLRGVTAQSERTATCLYTVAPAANFIIDRLPQANDVIVVSACSGHGFKHSAGEVLAFRVTRHGAQKLVVECKHGSQHWRVFG